MLFEFQRLENSKKHNSVHVTYYLSGSRKVEKPVIGNGQHQKGGEDVPMQSSPFLSSSMPQQEVEEVSIPAKTIMLVAEDDLNGECRRTAEDGITRCEFTQLACEANI
jgi:DNA polymerase delta subunit 3